MKLVIGVSENKRCVYPGGQRTGKANANRLFEFWRWEYQVSLPRENPEERNISLAPSNG